MSKNANSAHRFFRPSITIIDMWKALSAEEEEEREVDRPNDRYLAFVDYLGTELLYRDATRNADAIIERRNELEHGIQILLQPFCWGWPGLTAQVH